MSSYYLQTLIGLMSDWYHSLRPARACSEMTKDHSSQQHFPTSSHYAAQTSQPMAEYQQLYCLTAAMRAA